MAEHIHTLREAVAPVEVYRCADESEWDGAAMRPFQTYKQDLPDLDRTRRFKVTDVKGRPCYPQGTAGDVADDDAEEIKQQYNTGNTRDDLKALLKALQSNVTADDDSEEAKAFLAEQETQNAIERASRKLHQENMKKAQMKEKSAEVKTIMDIMSGEMSGDASSTIADDAKAYGVKFNTTDKETAEWGNVASSDEIKAARMIWHEFNTCAEVATDKCGEGASDACEKVSRSKFGPTTCAPKRLVKSVESEDEEDAQEAALRKIWKDFQVSASKKKLPEREKEARAYDLLSASSVDDDTTEEENSGDEANQAAMRNRTGLRRTGISVMRGGDDDGTDNSSSDSD